jgi:hypothetical protein
LALYVYRSKWSEIKNSVGRRNDANFCSNIVGNGRVKPTNDEQPKPHDYIEFLSLSIRGISEKVSHLYASGLSLRQISMELSCSKTYIRKTLLNAGMDLRSQCKSQSPIGKNPRKLRSGNPPFGYRILRGRLILDAAEIEVVQLVMNLWHSGMAQRAIARHLGNHKIKNRKGTLWDHSLVRSIVKRHRDKKAIFEEE